MFDVLQQLMDGFNRVPNVTGEAVEIDGQHYYVIERLSNLRGGYKAVEIDDPDDRNVFGKPLILICHRPTFDAELASILAKKRQERQLAFVSKAKAAQPETTEGTGFLLKRSTPWTVLMPSDKAVINAPCNILDCPARWAWSNSPMPKRVSDDKLLDCFCEGHRVLVDAYLAEHPDAWPPEVAE